MLDGGIFGCECSECAMLLLEFYVYYIVHNGRLRTQNFREQNFGGNLNVAQKLAGKERYFLKIRKKLPYFGKKFQFLGFLFKFFSAEFLDFFRNLMLLHCLIRNVVKLPELMISTFF